MNAFLSRLRSWSENPWAMALWIWGLAGVLTLWVHFVLRISIDNVSIGLILASALSSLYLKPFAAISLTLLASVLFLLFLVPPIGSLQIHLLLHEELVIGTSLIVALLIGILTSRLRQLIELSRRQATWSHRLNELAHEMRELASPIDAAPKVLALLQESLQAQGSIWCDPSPGLPLIRLPMVASTVDAAINVQMKLALGSCFPLKIQQHQTLAGQL